MLTWMNTPIFVWSGDAIGAGTSKIKIRQRTSGGSE